MSEASEGDQKVTSKERDANSATNTAVSPKVTEHAIEQVILSSSVSYAAKLKNILPHSKVRSNIGSFWR